MDLILEFRNGIISGEGHDGVGVFVIAGDYSTEDHECSWQKTYVGRHTVDYRGFGENNGIWGTWNLVVAKGGFHIWPLADGKPLTAEEEEDSSKQPATEPQTVRAEINR
jgi:hypothetical protein